MLDKYRVLRTGLNFSRIISRKNRPCLGISYQPSTTTTRFLASPGGIFLYSMCLYIGSFHNFPSNTRKALAILFLINQQLRAVVLAVLVRVHCDWSEVLYDFPLFYTVSATTIY